MFWETGPDDQNTYGFVRFWAVLKMRFELYFEKLIKTIQIRQNR